MISAWVVFPIVLTALCLGIGLLVERLSGRRFSGAVLPLLGLASLTVVGLATTASESTADWTPPVAAILGLVGFAATTRPAPDLRPDRSATLLAVAVFFAFGAPVILSGEATFAGYIKLDDTSTWFALTDRLMEHGRSLEGLAPSTYEATLAFNLDGWYPVGAFIPLGVGAKLAGQELAWIFQPYLSLLAAYSALGLWTIAGRLEARAMAVFVAAQAALLFAYAMWGGIKELATVALLALIAALAPAAIDDERPAMRRLLPLALAAAAMVGVLSFGAGPWLVGLFGVAALLIFLRGGLDRLLRTAGLFLVWLVPFVVVGLIGHPIFPDSDALLDSSADLGNLAQPISPFQAFGIWPAPDFRLDPESGPITLLLIVAAIVAVLFGAWRAWRDRDSGLLVALGGVVIGGLLIVAFGSAWVSAKAYSVISPFAMLFAFAGLSAVARLGRRTEAAVVAVLLAGGVIWSNVLAYGGANLAPRDQLAELERIGADYSGVEPVLMTEYQPYGVRHFLRDMAPEAAAELRRRQIALSDGGTLEKGESADIDRFALPELLTFEALVLRRSPAISRPPQPFQLERRGEFYEVWIKGDGPVPVAHLGMGDEIDAASTPDCEDVRALVGDAGVGGSLVAAAPGTQPIALTLGNAARSGGLEPSSAGLSYLEPRGAGAFEVSADIPEAGSYEVWLGGSIRPSADLKVDGAPAGGVRHQLNNIGQYLRLGEAELEPGTHTFRVDIGDSDVHPGSSGSAGPLGPLVISRADALPTSLTTVPVGEAESLCGQRWDWIEAIPG